MGMIGGVEYFVDRFFRKVIGMIFLKVFWSKVLFFEKELGRWLK